MIECSLLPDSVGQDTAAQETIKLARLREETFWQTGGVE